MANLLRKIILDPYPLRSIALELIRRWRLGSYEERVRIGAVDRPGYGYCLYHAASLARKLGYPRISCLEFGVAGGNGLLNLEYHAREIARCLAVEIEIYGFDSGEGLPEPADYRDLPYHWERGYFRMDPDKLRARLKKARLVLGDVEITARDFLDKYRPAPIGAILYDLDFYSSTIRALKVLEGNAGCFLPRVFCYFDDIIGTEEQLYNNFTGERLAIEEFNQGHAEIKLAPPCHLFGRKVVEPWHHKIRICHFFRHPRYNQFIGTGNQQLPLQP